MAIYNFDQVNLLLVEPDRGARESIRNILYDAGFREMRVGGSVSFVREELLEFSPDLFICDTELPDGNLYQLIEDIRHDKLGSNPFMTIIATTWNPTAELVKKVVNSGTDDLITKPVSAADLLSRLRSLVSRRKNFIVTSDYIGPDRQKTSERRDDDRLITVPNAFKEKASGNLVINQGNMIQSALSEVNEQRLESYAADIGSGVQFVLPRLAEGRVDGLVTTGLERLARMLGDAQDRMEGTKYAHVSELCQSLHTVVDALIAAGDSPADKDIKLLEPMSQAILAGFDLSDETATAAQEILASVSSAARLDAGADMAEARKNVQFKADAKPRPAQEASLNKRHKFLLRLLTGKISRLFGDRKNAPAMVPRQFIQGFDVYLGMLLGEDLYDELNSSARDLLDNFDTDDDTVIWRAISNDREYLFFTFNILIRILMKFENYERGKLKFLSIINTAIRTLDRGAAAAGSRDVMTETHFELVFVNLFAGVFELLDDEEQKEQFDERFGDGTLGKLQVIHKSYKKHIKPGSLITDDDLNPEAAAN